VLCATGFILPSHIAQASKKGIFITGGNMKEKRIVLFRGGWAKDAPFTDEFILLCNKVAGKSGVYLFYAPNMDNGKDRILYIGKSDNLGSRMIGSFSDKNRYFDKLGVMVSYVLADSPDAGLLELWFISYFQPLYNKRDNKNGKITLSLAPIPQFSNGVLILNGDNL
jgi:hypothetical protein